MCSADSCSFPFLPLCVLCVRSLALVCLMRAECWQASGLVEYNFSCFREAIQQLLAAQSKFKGTDAPKTPAKQSLAASSAASAATSIGAGAGAGGK